jgi:hypothetical protein
MGFTEILSLHFLLTAQFPIGFLKCGDILHNSIDKDKVLLLVEFRECCHAHRDWRVVSSFQVQNTVFYKPASLQLIDELQPSVWF